MAMTISIDDELKQEFTNVCSEIGLSASAAFTVFAKAVVREGRIPFELSTGTTAQVRTLEHELSMRGWQAVADLREGNTHSWEDVLAARALQGR